MLPETLPDPRTEEEQRASEWPELEPLTPPEGTPDPFPVDALGDVLGNAAKAINETIMAPMELGCQSVLAAASFFAQSVTDVELPWQGPTPTSMFFLTVAVSGERKSAIDSAIFKDAAARVRHNYAQFELAMEEYEHQSEVYSMIANEAKKKEAKGLSGSSANDGDASFSSDKPVMPLSPLQFVTDPTVEGIYKLFQGY